MNQIDWIVLTLILVGIIAYGLYKSQTEKNLEGYFLSNRSMPWYLVLLSVMGTQASAITFLSAPGQAFTDGMRFVQYYFGLPIAMVIICISFVPLFSRLKVFTAYEFLEHRFDIKTRSITSFLFLLSRGLSTGISIYAPAIILSSLFGWNIYITNIIMGGLLIIYTVSGGAKAVAYTQQLQLIIIFAGMAIAAFMIVHLLPNGFGFMDALKISGSNGKLNVITTGFTKNGFDWKDKYNLLSGIIGGFFLALSYFGTDQSQVGRYLTAKNDKESKMGLLLNGLVKVPMQFGILLIGALLFTFYQFSDQPIFFNNVVHEQLLSSSQKHNAISLEQQYNQINAEKQVALKTWNTEPNKARAKLQELNVHSQQLKTSYQGLFQKAGITGDTNDTNYIFLRFVVDYLPHGLVGLLIAIIFLAAWGSTAAALNSLAATSVIDFHLRFQKKKEDLPVSYDEALNNYKISKFYTLAWGIFCVVVAEFVIGMGSLIEAVNVLGSLFYGVILGIFLVAFYMKSVKGNAVFWAAIVSELVVILVFILNKYNIIGVSFLWLNVIGTLLVAIISRLIQILLPNN
ncbi:MAG: sodium:solute symporter [Hydrotalea flava]|uniref:sodium:solute symporter n=1 Tax=Hydrotalea TaxID=1004300 RepID=UPI000945579B|nr:MULTISPECIES: sodium:solute symporter [Hydrotalea]NIM35231.1 sodium:solute symporter [Hydrotalea flava]NIM38068.1 sodium:solute symporter [Hydrotalea flava]NIN03840.1 sodium:solute symporter [Hydrotalea flava]NIN14926.1 sodium:solute symporter [Hydrotalea flava]NIO93994.1 sodium:solute symporter [Hydrotalea flava]